MASPAPFIWSALYSVASQADYRMFPSSERDIMLLFRSSVERDLVLEQAPVFHNGVRLSLVKPEDTLNRFRLQLNWLVAISVTRFPLEHWNPTGIPAAFRMLGPVVEIDSDCVSGDFASVRVVVAMANPDPIPPFLRVATKDRLGSTFQVEVLRVLRRDEMADGDGFLRPFFPSNRPTGGPAGGGLPPHLVGHPVTAGNHLPHQGPAGPPPVLWAPVFGDLVMRGLPGFNSFFTGVIQPFQLASLPRLPLVLSASAFGLVVAVERLPPLAAPLLALPWYDASSLVRGSSSPVHSPASPLQPSPACRVYARWPRPSAPAA